MTLKNERIMVKKSASSPISPQSSIKIAMVFTGLIILYCIRTFLVPVTSNCDRNISSLLISHYFPFFIVADIWVFIIS